MVAIAKTNIYGDLTMQRRLRAATPGNDEQREGLLRVDQ